MTTFYDLLDNINTQLKADSIVNTVTEGSIFDVDLEKQSIFPLSHIIVNQATKETNVWRFNLTVLSMDIVDKNNDYSDALAGNDNVHDILNTQLAVLGRLIDYINNNTGPSNKYVIDGEPTLEPFTERFENYLAGWAMTFDVIMPNLMSKC